MQLYRILNSIIEDILNSGSTDEQAAGEVMEAFVQMRNLYCGEVVFTGIHIWNF
jgi:hypothetical protein